MAQDTFRYVPIVTPSSKDLNRQYFVTKFPISSDVDFNKNSVASISRENNLPEFKIAHDINPVQQGGAGSEFGKEEREEARRRRYGIKVKNYNPADQPFVLKTVAKGEKRKYKGVKNAGIIQNTGYIALIDHGDHMQVLPVSEFYDFNPMIKRKTFNETEAEEFYKNKNKTYDYFNLMKGKKETKDDDDDENCGYNDKDKLILTGDDIMSDSNDDSDDEADDEKKKKKKKKSSKQYRHTEVDEALDDEYNKQDLDYAETDDEDDEDENNDDDEDNDDGNSEVSEEEDKSRNDKEDEDDGKKLFGDSDSDSSSSSDSEDTKGEGCRETTKASTSTLGKRKSEVSNVQVDAKKSKIDSFPETVNRIKNILSKGPMKLRQLMKELKKFGNTADDVGKAIQAAGVRKTRIGNDQDNLYLYIKK